MNIEMSVLVWSTLFGFFQLFLATAAVTAQRGLKWNVSSREQQLPPPSGMAGRLSRAFENFKETFPFFVAAVAASQFLSRHNSNTEWGAQLYLAGRVLYLPIYAFGVTHIRTVAWGVATLGIFLILTGVLNP